jgi:hypothetical protein
MKTEGGPRPAEEGSPNGHKPNLKERAVHQLREFLAMFIYLWVLLTLFVINQSAVLAREHHNYQAHFFAFINALILAKILLIGEDLHLGNRFRDKPLLYSIFYKCFVFTIFFIGVHLLERVIVGVWSGRTIAQSFPDIGGGSLNGILSLGATVFVALIPFFNQQSDRPRRTLVSPLKSWKQGLHSSIEAATVIRRYGVGCGPVGPG